MTNQEIYNELGNAGTITGLFIEMSNIDGQIDNSEIETIILALKEIVEPSEINPAINKYFNIRSNLGLERMINYLDKALVSLAKDLDEDMIDQILESLKEIAGADGKVDKSEVTLYHFAVERLKKD